MGDLLRRYWVPALLERDIIGTASLTVRLFGEDLVAALADRVFTSSASRRHVPDRDPWRCRVDVYGAERRHAAAARFRMAAHARSRSRCGTKCICAGTAWHDAVEDAIDDAMPTARALRTAVLPAPRRSTRTAFVPADDDTTCIWTFRTHAAGDVADRRSGNARQLPPPHDPTRARQCARPHAELAPLSSRARRGTAVIAKSVAVPRQARDDRD